MAVTGVPVVALNPVAGLHAYVPAPLAVRLVDDPAHSVTLDETLTVGVLFTVTITLAVLVQPPASVPVTV